MEKSAYRVFALEYGAQAEEILRGKYVAYEHMEAQWINRIKKKDTCPIRAALKLRKPNNDTANGFILAALAKIIMEEA